MIVFKDNMFTDIQGNYTHNQTQNLNINVNTEELLAKFKKWLNAPDPSTNHNNARKKYHEGTGQWLLEDGKYATWKQESNSFMWINGISGCGKTLVCSTIIEDIKAIVKTQPRTGLAFFYFDINDKTKQSSRNLLSSLVLSLTAKSNDYSPLERLYMELDKLHLPTERELLDLLRELLQFFKQAYIVIDALDECDDYDQLFNQVIRVMRTWNVSHLHVFMSSRREQNIIITMKECVTAEICLSADLVGSDIISYIYSFVRNDSGLKRWGHAVQQSVVDALITGANGMFRWVSCQFEELQ
ncbi:hypothetical protein AX14_012942 [Amanita brunnescens Koide BX004]|nr:hypothetical protein AX14_012942 [Amanita brunnescens Koide BX004]